MSSTSASTEPDDGAIESFYVDASDFRLPTGKTPPAPKTKQASREASLAHIKSLKSKYIELGSQGYRELGRLNIAWVPATYVTMEKKVSNGPEGFFTCDLALLTAEGEEVGSIDDHDIAAGDCNAPQFSLVKTARGIFFDMFGVDKPVYVLRSPNWWGALLSSQPLCIGRMWDVNSGEVRDVKLPDFPARGKMIGPDDLIVFPSRAFHFELDSWPNAEQRPTREESDACVGSFVYASVDVMGVDSPSPDFRRDDDAVANIYRQMQKQARANAKTASAWAREPAPVVRKWQKARFKSACALDLAQLAAQLYVYGRTLGASSEEAIAEADAVMKNHQLVRNCTEVRGAGAKDKWPNVRAALLAWNLKPTSNEAPDADAPAASASNHATPSASSSTASP
jgi:hypothetical protein